MTSYAPLVLRLLSPDQTMTSCWDFELPPNPLTIRTKDVCINFERKFSWQRPLESNSCGRTMFASNFRFRDASPVKLEPRRSRYRNRPQIIPLRIQLAQSKGMRAGKYKLSTEKNSTANRQTSNALAGRSMKSSRSQKCGFASAPKFGFESE